jgi:protein SCO1/2
MRQNAFIYKIITSFSFLVIFLCKTVQSDIRFDQHLRQTLPKDATLVDEYGEKHPLKDYLGSKPIILVFTYYRCPNLCTLVLNGLLQALKKLPDRLGKDYQVFTVSINPSERPSLALAKKRTYLAKLGVTESKNQGETPWHFFTAASVEDQNIPHLAELSGFKYDKDPRSGEYAHPSGIIILTPDGTISQYFFGIQYEAQALHQSLLEARSGKQGSLIEEILLYCFHYDPKLTRNGPIVMETIRIAGIGGVLVILIFILFLFYSDLREPKA